MPVVMLQQARRRDGVGHSFTGAMRVFVSEYIADVLRHVEAGMTIADACRAVPGAKAMSVRQFISKRPEWRAAFDKAFGPTSVDIVRANLDKLLATIAGGMSAAEACATLGLRHKAFQALCREDESTRQRYAKAQRKRGGKAVADKPIRRWKAADFEAALEFIRTCPASAVKFAIPDTLPSLPSCYQRARKNRRFAEGLARAVRVHFIATTPTRAGADVALNHSDLLENEIYAAAWRRFKGFDQAERDDLIQEFILRVLEGEMTVDDLSDRRRRRTVMSAVRGAASAFLSLDAPDRTIGGLDDVSLRVDMIASETEIFHY